ncbi:IQ and AAA domain-containing protein 1-like [Phthorimaea operculella]|nr:IQ and AAA domain-containing protein 1-like [Phthorimaea operculella]
MLVVYIRYFRSSMTMCQQKRPVMVNNFFYEAMTVSLIVYMGCWSGTPDPRGLTMSVFYMIVISVPKFARIDAVKFDISPEVFSSKMTRPSKMLKLVLEAAKIFQPSVIFFKDIERVFLKEVPPKEKYLQAGKMKNALKRMLNKFPITEKVIFIATCSQPFLAKVGPMMKMFDETIVVPKPDYGSLSRFFYDRFQNIRSMPRDYCVQALAKCLEGIGFGLIMEAFDTIMNPVRICQLNITPLNQHEFIEYMIKHDIEAIDERDYKKMMELWLKYSPLKKERAQYAIINEMRDAYYKKLEKVNADKEAKAGKAKRQQ